MVKNTGSMKNLDKSPANNPHLSTYRLYNSFMPDLCVIPFPQTEEQKNNPLAEIAEKIAQTELEEVLEK
jgi:hypothetical protein